MAKFSFVGKQIQYIFLEHLLHKIIVFIFVSAAFTTTKGILFSGWVSENNWPTAKDERGELSVISRNLQF